MPRSKLLPTVAALAAAIDEEYDHCRTCGAEYVQYPGMGASCPTGQHAPIELSGYPPLRGRPAGGRMSETTMQACPVCLGRGVVGYPPGTPATQRAFASTSSGPWPCPTCARDAERAADRAIPLLMAITMWAMDRWPDADWSEPNPITD